MIAPRSSALFVCRFLTMGIWRYGRNCIASLIKIAVGRRAYFSANDVLLRQYLGQLLGISKISEITSAAAPSEGAGSHALMTMHAIRFARRFGLTYVHTRLAGIRHSDRPAGDREAAWEAHFNLGAGEASAGRDPINYALTFPTLHALFGNNGDYDLFDEEMVRDFRRKYYSNKSPRQNATFTVCVHIRRRNAHDFHDDDSTNLRRLAKTLNHVRSLLNRRGIQYDLRIFSQGRATEFRDMEVAEETLFLDIDPIATMGELVEGDLLIITKGSFSYVSGLLCDGVVIADTHAFPPPLAHWQTYDLAGGLDVQALDRRLPPTAQTA